MRHINPFEILSPNERWNLQSAEQQQNLVPLVQKSEYLLKNGETIITKVQAKVH